MSALTASTNVDYDGFSGAALSGAPDRQVYLSGVTKRFGHVHAVDDVTLEVARGEFLAILGPSGSGKTTTMRMIGGFVRPDAGRVEIGGRDVTHLPPHRRDVNTVFQSYALFPHMTVERNVAYGLRVKHVPKRERQRRVREALELVRLEHAMRMRPAQLSGGMQQRVALARAIVNQPAVLLLDEPLGALDRKLREDMQVELRRLQTTLGITFVYITHDQDEALGMSDRLVVMRNGRVEQEGRPDEVYDTPANLWVAGFVGSSNQIKGTVAGVGHQVEIDSDAAQLASVPVSAAVGRGSRVTAVVRPENVMISFLPPTSERNRVRVEVREVLSLGAQVKVLASTAGGLELLARRERATVDELELRPGTDVWFSWAPESVRVYPSEEGGAASAETPDR
jgi:spermidine/putrescine transport system ATP-binding protein